jgi:radical SAM protein with 4Fe4S-binding SPASM domain
MVTAGRGIDPQRAQAAQLAGLQSVSVSIDGSPTTHDSLRNFSGSHRAALRAMQYLAQAGIQVSANSQLGRRNYRELPQIFDTIAQAGAHSWQIQLTVPGGRAADDPTLILEPYQVLEVFSAIAWLKPQADAASVRIWPGNNLGYFGPYEHLLRGNLLGGYRGSCGAGCVTMGIESNGDIKGCPSLPSAAYTGGNVRENSLGDIWYRAEPLRFARNHRVDELWGYCAECYYAEHCLAGCSWTAHSLFGRRGNNPLCHHRALEMLKRGRRERLVQIKWVQILVFPCDHAAMGSDWGTAS